MMMIPPLCPLKWKWMMKEQIIIIRRGEGEGNPEGESYLLGFYTLRNFRVYIVVVTEWVIILFNFVTTELYEFS